MGSLFFIETNLQVPTSSAVRVSIHFHSKPVRRLAWESPTSAKPTEPGFDIQ